MRAVIVIAIVGLIGCAEFPALDGTIDAEARDAPFPTLEPLDPLLARVDAATARSTITPASVASLNGRIAALQSKARGLRGPVIDAATRARMRRGVAIPAAIR